MSLATEYAPSVPLPIAARALTCVPTVVPDRAGDLGPGAGSPGLASVTVLRPPADAASVPVRLTRRGVVVIAAAVVVLGAVLVWLAALSAPADPPAPAAGPAVVTVHSGDTLWSIAGRVAPTRDPRAEIATLQKLNRLRGAALVPGQQLHVR